MNGITIHVREIGPAPETLQAVVIDDRSTSTMMSVEGPAAVVTAALSVWLDKLRGWTEVRAEMMSE